MYKFYNYKIFLLFSLIVMLWSCQSKKIETDQHFSLDFQPNYTKEEATELAFNNTAKFFALIKDHPKKNEIKSLHDKAILSIYANNMNIMRGIIGAKEGINNLIEAIEKYKQVLVYLPNYEFALDEIIVTYLDVYNYSDNLKRADKIDRLNILLEAEKYAIKLVKTKDEQKNLPKNYINYGRAFCLYGGLAYKISTYDTTKEIQYKYNVLSQKYYETCLKFVKNYQQESLINLLASFYLDYFYFVDNDFSHRAQETFDMLKKINNFFDVYKKSLSNKNKKVYKEYFSDKGFIEFLNNYFKKNNIEFRVEPI